jgi:release factor glutamine methyltransferase
MGQTVVQELKQIEIRLHTVSGEVSLFEAEQILQFIFNCSRSNLYVLLRDQLLSEIQFQKISRIIDERLTGKPLSQILGFVDFYNSRIRISQNVLIPRPETEILVDTIFKKEDPSQKTFLDMCTGSGAIIASLCKERKNWIAFGMDISLSALRIAKKNISPQTTLVCSDMFSSLKDTLKCDFIVSNPPYISLAEMSALDKSVIDFEPTIALYGGFDGFDFYRNLSAEAPLFLKSNGRIYCEIGYNQKEAVITIFQQNGWKDIQTFTDLSQKPRVIMAHRQSGN